MKKTITILLFALFTGVLSAQTVSIQGGSTYPTITDAIFAAVDGNVILISGTHTVSINIDKSITLRGSNPATDIIQAAATPSTAGGGTRVISIGAPSPATTAALNVTVENLTIRHGSITGANGGGINVDKITGLVTLNNLIVSNNFTTTNGGGIGIAGSNVNITNCTVQNNASTQDGGAIIAAPNNASLTNNVVNIKQSLLNANTARNGGGIYINGNLTFGNTYKIDVNIENSTISNNSSTNASTASAVAGGGAICSNSQPWTTNTAIGNVTLNLIHATLYNNSCPTLLRAGIQFNNAKATNFGAYNSIIVGNDDLTATGPKAINFANTNITNVVNCIIGGTNAPPAIVSDPIPNANNNQPGKSAAHAGITGTLTSEGGSTQVFKLDTPANTAVDYCTVATGITIPTIDQRGVARTGTYDAGAYESGCNPGTQPTNVNCWDNYQLVSCVWTNTGSQPAAPTGLACYENASFNSGTCSWVVTGTQPAPPTLECYQTLGSFNNTTCAWDVTGTAPVTPEPPTGLVCYETAIYNGCAWVISGTQPAPPTLECYQTLGSFNTVTCVWEVLGTPPAAPNAGTDGTLNATSSPSDAALFAALTGADAGGIWTRPVSGFEGVYTYTVTQAAPCSATDTSIVTVTTTQIPGSFPAFCKGATVATAVGSTSMKFYTAATGGTALAGTTALSNAKTYFVSEVINTVETARVSRLITVNNLPVTPTLLVSNPIDESKLICKYIGSSTPVTFDVTATGAVSYIWTVPAGASIVSGNNTSSVGVSFAGASTVAGVIGAVVVRSVDANGCASLPKSLTITTKAPTAPSSLVMTSTDSTPHFNVAVVPATIPASFNFVGLNTLTKITKVGPYMGTSTVFTLTAPEAVTAASYEWTLPSGVNQLSGGTSNIITADFAGVPAGIGSLPIVVKSVGGCGLSSARTLTLGRTVPSAPKALTLTNATQPNLNALLKITKVGPYTGTSIPFTLTATPFLTQGATSTSYAWLLPAGVTCQTASTPITVYQNVNFGTAEVPNIVYTAFSAIETPTNTITVNFSTATGIGNLELSVFGVNGAGNSVARKLVLARATPTAPTKLVLTDDAISTVLPVTKVGPYTAKTTPLTLTATPFATQGAEATSYKWTLPDGVNVTAGATEVSDEILGTKTWTSTGVVLTINLAGISGSSMTSIPLSVQAVNGAGTSATTRTLTVTAAAPAPPTIVGSGGTGLPTEFSSCATKTYTATPILGATYTWSVPAGASIVGATDGNIIVVDYSLTSVLLTKTGAVTCFATNGTGSSTVKSYTVKRIAGGCRLSNSSASAFSVKAYPNPSSSEFTIETSAKGAMSVKVYDMQGRLVEKANTDKIGSKLAAGAYNVIVNQGTNTKSVRVIKK